MTFKILSNIMIILCNEINLDFIKYFADWNNPISTSAVCLLSQKMNFPFLTFGMGPPVVGKIDLFSFFLAKKLFSIELFFFGTSSSNKKQQTYWYLETLFKCQKNVDKCGRLYSACSLDTYTFISGSQNVVFWLPGQK